MLTFRYNASAMAKQHYFFTLIPPRPTFPQDITAEEKALMDAHALYFQRQFEAGKLLLYGPVLATGGAFGVGILEVADESEARHFGENDPSVLGGLNRWELYPMRVTNARTKG
ncbi:MAG TPA: YciI family protein [Terriglobales bacterium]|nr:YciI family protein [Terriglobales bacterium]